MRGLDGYTGRATTCTKLVAGEAIATFHLLDVERARQEADLPYQIRSTLSLSDEDWKEVMAIARANMAFVEDELKRPQWTHLRKPPG